MQNNSVAEFETLEKGLTYLFLGYESEFEGAGPVEQVEEEVFNAETRLKRLKFGYLERETKDKFLRRVSDFDNGGEVSEEAMRKARSETETRESDLEQANTRLQEGVKAFEALASETTSIYEQLQERMTSVKLVLAKMEARRAEMEAKLKSTSVGKDFQLLQTDQLEKELDTKNSQLSEVNTILNSTENTHETLADLEHRVNTITEENNRLESQGPPTNLDESANPFQGQGQRLQLLCQLLKDHLAGDSITVDPVADGFEISSALFSLHLGNDERVTLVLGQLPTGIEEPLKRSKLPVIISKMW